MITGDTGGKQMTAHTDTPYTTTWATGGGLKPHAVEVYASDGTIVASIESEDRETAIANAEFIVKACNMHEGLMRISKEAAELARTVLKKSGVMG